MISNYKNLFEFVEKNKSITEQDRLLELSLPVTPHNAVKIFSLFIEGKCVGNNLIAAKQWFRSALQQASKLHPVYKLYNGMLEIISIKQIILGQEGKLLGSIDQITDYTKSDTMGSMPYMAILLQSKYFRALFSQALHLFWQEYGVGFK